MVAEMNTPKLPPPPKPDTHCFDEATGKDVWSHSPEQMQAYALAAIEALWAQLGQGVPTDEQIMATVGRKGFGFSDSRPLGQQWDHVCELIRAVVRERYTHPAPQQKPLTDEQISAFAKQAKSANSPIACFVELDIYEFARAIEAAHNIGEKK